jgi:hypothetical protein
MAKTKVIRRTDIILPFEICERTAVYERYFLGFLSETNQRKLVTRLFAKPPTRSLLIKSPHGMQSQNGRRLILPYSNQTAE